LAILALTFTFSSSGLLQAQESADVIMPKDLISVQVFQESDLSARIRVTKDGRINLPLIGSVKVAGMTAEKAAQQITGRLKDGYLVNPQVTVTVVTYAKKRFTVLGQVNQPGTYEVAANKKISLLEVIGIAGGYTRIANQKKVTVKYQQGGRDRIRQFDAKLMAESASEGSYLVKDGDIISVGESNF
ncbi:MAG: polysaccharide biosynthesis/export family protein, partial [Verrucomicrobiota bacterium]